jgi:hypothetical protein
LPGVPVPRRLAALVLSGLLLACGADSAHRAASGRIDEAGKLSVFELRVGDCLDPGRSLDDAVSKVRVVPCADLHTHEVFATATVPGTGYPGAEKVKRFADATCSDKFDAYVGTAYTASTLLYTYLQPSPDSWEKERDHQVVCLVVSKKPVARSLAGSKR